MKLSILAAMTAFSLAAASTLASPVIDSAKLNTRVFNDNAGSTLSTVNSYPALVQFQDSNLLGGNANRHNFRLSTDSGATSAKFANADSFKFFTDVTITGPGSGEAGINVSPWYSSNVDGMFNLRTSDGEVAVFGGRLPFYSFSANQGVSYVKGTTIRLGVEYEPRDLNATNPGMIRYWYGGLTSGWLNFDEGNVGEGPIYGLWGTLKDASVGGYAQILGATGMSNIGNQGGLTVTFENSSYVPAPGAAGLLGVAGLLAARRRRR